MGLTPRQLREAKRYLSSEQYRMASKYRDRFDDVAINMHHRNIQEMLTRKGFVPSRSDVKAFRKNCKCGAHNSVDLWFKFLPSHGYGGDGPALPSKASNGSAATTRPHASSAGQDGWTVVRHRRRKA